MISLPRTKPHLTDGFLLESDRPNGHSDIPPSILKKGCAIQEATGTRGDSYSYCSELRSTAFAFIKRISAVFIRQITNLLDWLSSWFHPESAPDNRERPLSKIQERSNLFKSIEQIPDIPRSKYRFESTVPERFIEAPYATDGFFEHFQIGDIPFSPQFGCFEGPQIARYNTEGHQFPAMLCKIKLNETMCRKLPYLPDTFKSLDIKDGYLTIWGNLPHEQAGKGGGEHLMFRPQILLGQIPNSYGMLNKGVYPLEIGVFTDNHNFVGLDKEKEDADHPSSLPLGKLGSRSYDCHGDDDDPASGTYDDTYLTSVMGTFDIQGTSDFTVFAKLKRDTENYRSFPQGAYENMVSYNICLTDQLTENLAPIFHRAPNLQKLIQDLYNWTDQAATAGESDLQLKKAIVNLVHVFS